MKSQTIQHAPVSYYRIMPEFSFDLNHFLCCRNGKTKFKLLLQVSWCCCSYFFFFLFLFVSLALPSNRTRYSHTQTKNQPCTFLTSWKFKHRLILCHIYVFSQQYRCKTSAHGHTVSMPKCRSFFLFFLLYSFHHWNVCYCFFSSTSSFLSVFGRCVCNAQQHKTP